MHETAIYGETSISVYSDFYEEWDEDENWEECWDCRGTGLDRDEMYDCPICGGEGEVRIYDSKRSVETVLTDGV